MDRDDSELIKQRQLLFIELHPDPNQAQTAADLLLGIEGIISASAETPIVLTVRYNVMQISLEQIETGLTETGFHLSSKLLYILKRALYYYTEETQRANSGCPRGDSNCTKKIFVDRYVQRDHSLRDHRPEYWRKYL
ncbi:MAG: hypothetical protein KDI27_06375 [Gammaproteobacteria bacterium]|nr:hypothetical protein [Gammaproteobacteria bacterium]MCP5418453.1 hypothetical protein [Chromatiaceae bacterium]